MKIVISLFLICSLWFANTQISYAATTNKTSQMIYSKILNAVKHQETKVDLSSYLRNGKAFSWQYLYDIENKEPAIFYLDFHKIKFWSNGVLELGYKYPKSTILAMQKKMNNNAKSVIQKVIKKGMTDYQKVMVLHDYMADYITYDKENYQRNTIPEYSFTAYGALVKKIAVCDGYAQAMNYLLKMAGIESHRVVGRGYQDGSSEAHAWNLVKVSGTYYYMDLTWDDHDISGRADTSYKYFLVTQQELSLDHGWDITGLPKAVSTKYKNLHAIDHDVFKTKEGLYFSNDQDNNRLYFVKLDGTGKKRLTNDRAISPVVSGRWIYFSNYSMGGYLYKVKTNGSQLTKLNEKHTIPLAMKDGRLIVKDGNTNKQYAVSFSR
ncbi:DUF5050 domain-containing protein [Neobacillus niacini]|uniref:DUF5050 domain-containing protein n=1 Tax=Neobacillus niacini TaxID=86668 RepID=UPI002865AD11|nr:DUF5050 domain-containing protein [Neobacillus niacini]MDR7000097.1 hypothetical protein [Neobacillus niacini]